MYVLHRIIQNIIVKIQTTTTTSTVIIVLREHKANCLRFYDTHIQCQSVWLCVFLCWLWALMISQIATAAATANIESVAIAAVDLSYYKEFFSILLRLREETLNMDLFPPEHCKSSY